VRYIVFPPFFKNSEERRRGGERHRGLSALCTNKKSGGGGLRMPLENNGEMKYVHVFVEQKTAAIPLRTAAVNM
jgi:hypothetical protein